jgi:hypothetical protein
VTVLESKGREKGSNDSESSSETETEVGTEAETEMAFSVIGAVFFCKENRGLCFSMGGGDYIFKWYNGDRQTL